MKQDGISRREVLMALGTGMVAAGLSANAAAADSPALEASVELLRKALESGDGKVLEEILHDHLTYSHSDGRVWSKQVLLSNIAGKQRYLSIVISAQTVDVLGQVAIVRHTYDVVNNDDKKSTSHIKVLMCWTSTGQAWQLLARSGSNATA